MNEILDESLPPPGQDPELWKNRLFTEINAPADWCTVRQAAEHQESGVSPDNLLQQIASGKVESSVYTAAEALQLLELLAQRQKQE